MMKKDSGVAKRAARCKDGEKKYGFKKSRPEVNKLW